MRDIIAELRHGYVHRHDLIDRGWRPDAIRRAAQLESLTIVRRAWVVDPRAHPLILRAAQSGGILTCVSAGEWAGAWRPEGDTKMHLSIHPHSGLAIEGARTHRSTGPLPRPTRLLVDHVENALATAASCLPHDDALAVWESFVKKRLITLDRLTAVAWRGERARRLRTEVSDRSDSGLETLFVQRLSRRGVRVLQQVVLGDRPVDGLIGSWLVTQIDGFAHHSDARHRRSDISHDRMLRLQGYTVFRFDYHEIMHEWPRIEAQILVALAQGLHTTPRGRRRSA